MVFPTVPFSQPRSLLFAGGLSPARGCSTLEVVPLHLSGLCYSFYSWNQADFSSWGLAQFEKPKSCCRCPRPIQTGLGTSPASRGEDGKLHCYIWLVLGVSLTCFLCTAKPSIFEVDHFRDPPTWVPFTRHFVVVCCLGPSS